MEDFLRLELCGRRPLADELHRGRLRMAAQELALEVFSSTAEDRRPNQSVVLDGPPHGSMELHQIREQVGLLGRRCGGLFEQLRRVLRYFLLQLKKLPASCEDLVLNRGVSATVQASQRTLAKRGILKDFLTWLFEVQ